MQLTEESANSPDRDWIEDLVHDLRSALARIHSGAELLLELGDSLEEDEHQRCLTAIQSGVVRANELVLTLRERSLSGT